MALTEEQKKRIREMMNGRIEEPSRFPQAEEPSALDMQIKQLSSSNYSSKKMKKAQEELAPDLFDFKFKPRTKFGNIIREFLYPSRGFSEDEISAAEPTLRDKAVAVGRSGAEILEGTRYLFGLGLSASLKLAGKDEMAKKIMDNYEKAANESMVSKFSKPLTPEEQRAMREIDVFTAILPMGKIDDITRNIPKLAKRLKNVKKVEDVERVLRKNAGIRLSDDVMESISKTKNVDEISSIIKKEVIPTYKPKNPIEKIDTITQKDTISEVINKRKDEILQAVSNDKLNFEDFGKLDDVSKIEPKNMSTDDMLESMEILKRIDIDVADEMKITNPAEIAKKENFDKSMNLARKADNFEDFKASLNEDLSKTIKETGDTEKQFFIKAKRVERGEQATGALFGIEKDEQGNITFSPEKALLGVAGFTAAQKVKPLVRKTTGQVKPKELKQLGQKLKAEARGARKGVVSGKEIVKEGIKKKNYLARLKDDIFKAVSSETTKSIRELRKKIGFERKTKRLSNSTILEVKERAGVKEWKNAGEEELSKVLNEFKKLKEGDKFLTSKQKKGLSNIIGDDANLTIREIKEKYDIGEVLKTSGLQYVSPILRFKEKSPIIKNVIDNVQSEAQLSRIRKNAITKLFNKKQSEAFSSTSFFKSKKKTWNDIFRYLSGEEVKLTDKEKEFGYFIKNYFSSAKNYLIENGDMARGRKDYVPHLAKELSELISDHGLYEGIKRWKNWKLGIEKEGDIPSEVWVALDDILGTKKFFQFAQQRKGGVEPTKNIDKIFKQYMQLFETKKYLDNVMPQIHGVASVLMEGRGQKFLLDYGKTIKGRGIDFTLKNRFSLMSKIVDRIVDVGYLFKLGFSTVSAGANLIGGEVMSMAYNPLHRYVLGKKRFTTNPVKTYKIMSKYGFLDGDYTELAKTSLGGKTAKLLNEAAFIQQRIAEYEIRASEIMGMMTRKEFKSGALSKKRIVEIMDVLEETQGVFTPERTPIAAKTALGRAALQFSRWMITNTSAVKKITTQAAKDIAKGKILSKDVRRLTKLISAFAVGGYMANEYSKSGNKTAEKLARTLQEPIRITLQTLSGQIALKQLSENPTLQTVQEALFTLEMIGYKMGINDYPQKIEVREGLGETYIAGERMLEQAGIVEAETAFARYQQMKNMSAEKANAELKSIEKEDPQMAGRIKKYIKWDKLGISRTEREFSYMGVKNGERAKAILRYIKKQKNKNETFKRLKEAGIISDTVEKQIKSLMKE